MVLVRNHAGDRHHEFQRVMPVPDVARVSTHQIRFESVDDETKALLNMNDGETVVIERIRYADDGGTLKPYIFPTFCVFAGRRFTILYECYARNTTYGLAHSRKTFIPNWFMPA